MRSRKIGRLSRWRLGAPTLVVGIAALVVCSGVLVPFAYLALRAIDAKASELGEIVFRTRNLLLFGNSVALVVGVVIVDIILALPFAWLTSRADLKARRFFTLMGVLPLAIPGYVMAYAFLGFGGADGAFAQIVGIDLPRPSGYWGALIALSFYTFPYFFLNLRSALIGVDPALEESARSLGYRPREVFYRVLLPQLKPALYAGGLLVGLHVLGDFGVVSLMRFETFSYALYLQLASFDRIYAAWLALTLLIFAGGLLYAEARLLRGLRLHRAGAGTAYRRTLTPLRGWGQLSYLYLCLLILVSLALPTATVALWLIKGFGSASLQDLAMALAGSLGVSIPAAFFGACLALPIVYLSVRHPSGLSRFLERVAYIGYATPPLAFGLSLIVFVLGAIPGFYQTLWVLIYAYTLHFMAEAIGPARSAIYQASPNVEEAARSLGYSRLGAFVKATLPLLIRGLIVGIAFVFLSAMKELPIAFLLSPTGYETLALNVWSNASEALFENAAPYALLMLIFSGLFVGLLLVRERGAHELPA